jgi:hypothetical protein
MEQTVAAAAEQYYRAIRIGNAVPASCSDSSFVISRSSESFISTAIAVSFALLTSSSSSTTASTAQPLPPLSVGISLACISLLRFDHVIYNSLQSVSFFRHTSASAGLDNVLVAANVCLQAVVWHLNQ